MAGSTISRRRSGSRTGCHHRPAELSGGQQQRVAIARALVSRPTVVFADEPTGNLDSATSGEILELMRHSVESYGQTMVMVTHDARAAEMADRLLFLGDGMIVKELPRSSAHDILRRSRRSSADDELRAARNARAQAAHGPDGARDHSRRRDGERDVRPHRLDHGRVQLHLLVHLPEHRRGDHRQGGVQPRRQRHAPTRRSTSRCCRR